MRNTTLSPNGPRPSPCDISSLGTVCPLHHYINLARFSSSQKEFLTPLDNEVELETYSQALEDVYLKKTMVEEIKALEDNGTRTIQPLPLGKTPIGCKWVFKIKHKFDGSIERFKGEVHG